MTGLDESVGHPDAGAFAGGGSSGAASGGASGFPATGGTTAIPRKPPPGTGGSRAVRVCGNGQIDPGEACDGPNLDGQSCASVTMGVKPIGVLRCSNQCTFDTAVCGQAFGMGGFTGNGGSPGAGGFGFGFGGPPTR